MTTQVLVESREGTGRWAESEFHERIQWEMPFSGSSGHGTPEPIFKTFCRVNYVGDPTLHAKMWISRPKGGVSAHA